MEKQHSLRNPKRKPTHPGAILREDVLPALRITQAEFAQRLGVSRLTVSEVLHEKRQVSVDMAIRLGKLLGNGAGLWLRMQQALDVWELEQSGDYAGIEPIEVKAA
jgi:antitoxin HigA-1